MKNYNIINLDKNEQYRFYVIISSSISPLAFLQNILEDISNYNQDGNILIDQILHVGNNDKRFICIDYKSTGQVSDKNDESMVHFVNIPKDDIYRKLSCQYLKNSELLDYSILSSIQKRMINKGIVI